MRPLLKLVESLPSVTAPPVEAPATSGADRRAYDRIAVGDLPWVRGARLKYGAPLSLIDLSIGGAQVESAVTLRPGSTIVVQIQGEDKDIALASQVLRCHIAAIAPVATYRGALAFKRAVRLPGLDVYKANAALDAAHEFARLTLAIKRLTAHPLHDPEAASPIRYGTVMTEVGRSALAAASAALALPSAKRGGPAFSTELAGLFREVTRGLDDGVSSIALLDRMARRLRYTIGVDIRLESGFVFAARRPSQAIYFDLPAAGDQPPARLLVDFIRDPYPTDMQFQLLKAAGHLATLVRDLDAPRGTRDPTTEVEAPKDGDDRYAVTAVMPVENDTAPALCKIVVRYADGRLLKGYTCDFLATKRYFHLAPSPDAPKAARITVPVGHLKAIFFVRDFTGESRHVERKTFDHHTSGRRIAITFLDDEQLIGTTLNYRPDGDGFFVIPADPKSNNLRVFVVARAVRHAQFV
jgi:PilZ domain